MADSEPASVPAPEPAPPPWSPDRVDRALAVALVLAIAGYVGFKVAAEAWSAPRGGTGTANAAGTPAPVTVIQGGDVEPKLLLQDEAFHIRMGLAYAETGLLDQAIWHQREALRINERNISALNNLGFWLLQKGRVGDAAAALERALKIEPGSERVRNNLAAVYAQGIASGATEEDKAHWRQRKELLEKGAIESLLPK